MCTPGVFGVGSWAREPGSLPGSPQGPLGAGQYSEQDQS